MIALDEILFNALRSDAVLMEDVGGRIVSTCFEVGPDEVDNTPLPCIIVMDDGLQNNPDTKDCEWEAYEDRVTASVEVDAESPKAVKALIRKVRHAIADYIQTLYNDGEEIPKLESIVSNGIAWDWMKPCYHSTLTYNCIIENE
jgi:ABC-type nitrate/sulfonate/bicarbonate transport system substrate-binding protein